MLLFASQRQRFKRSFPFAKILQNKYNNKLVSAS
jgi:hypothetical protein